jgi:hypothetical protein
MESRTYGRGSVKGRTAAIGPVVAAVMIGGVACGGGGGGSAVGFAPYVDTSVQPAYNLVDTAAKTGVNEYNLGFVTAGGDCEPRWGGDTGLSDDGVAAQIEKLRAKGGDVRVSFGGQTGTELATRCSSVSGLTAAYRKVVDAYKLTKVDFDIEGAALSDTAAGTRRAEAVAQLQKTHPELDVSLTLPVMPDGLEKAEVDLLRNTTQHGVDIGSVNIMAMDYGESFDGDMGSYALQAAAAAQKQIKSALGLSDDDAWKTLSVTSMIGVNDVTTETFTVADAKQLMDFAQSKGIGQLSIWSAGRDKPCPGGAKTSAAPACSSITQQPLEFTKTFGGSS